MFTPWQGGRGGRARPAAHPSYRLGQEIFQNVRAIRGVRDPDGRWHEASHDVDRVLWDSRANIWQTAPPRPPLLG